MINFEQKKQAVWRRIQKKLGFRAPPEVRKAIDEMAGSVYSKEELKEYELTVHPFMVVAKLAAKSTYLPPQRNTSNNREPYLRSLQKRLYLVNFVIDHHLELILHKNTRFPQVYPFRPRFNWKQICNKWNDTHSYDSMTPPVLKATYYRAAADKNVQKEFFKNLTKETNQGLLDIEVSGEITRKTVNNIRKFLCVRPSKMSPSEEAGFKSASIAIEEYLKEYLNYKKLKGAQNERREGN
jgi:hypothetical protein